jgi:Zn-finger nucleic acid-binding protein
MALMKKKEKIINCPVDQTPMIKLTSKGVTVDKCPKCGGIWLDKGEMKRIIENFEAQQEKIAKQQLEELKNFKKK